VSSFYSRRASRLLIPLSFSLASVATGFAAPLRPTTGTPDSSGLAAVVADTLAAPADTLQALATAPADTLPHIHPRDANGRITDYTVAPGVTWHYEKTKPLRWALHIPRDLIQYPGFAFRKENTTTIAGIVAGSVALWVADQVIVDEAQQFGRFLNLTPKSTQRTLFHVPFHIGSANLPFEFNVPDNLNSTFYYIGDGWTHLTIASSFWVYGAIKKDNRALQTSSQLGEAIFSTGLVVQAMKRLTGRQSPYVATKDRGEWHLFPSYNRYQNFVPNYDAFPTGHLATAMATLTVIAENYPEYHFIRPVGYGLMGLLGYAMLNNGVHWASDYPIGIALGYGFAKIAVRNGRTRVVDGAPVDPTGKGTGFQILPRPKPWYRQGQLAPYVYGPFTGASWSLRM
jgi:membrane-associated phospholipid phosphatase